MKKNNQYTNNLILEVINNSTGSTWEDAVNEWDITDCEEDITSSSRCICGKESIKYLFTIKNQTNQNILFPIGSSCIKKFDRDDLNSITKVKQDMFKLMHALEKNQFIELTSEFFTKKLLLELFKEGAFKPNKYNNYEAKKDYDFLLKMFNKKYKDEITEKQNKKINALIMCSIKPFLLKKLKTNSKKINK